VKESDGKKQRTTEWRTVLAVRVGRRLPGLRTLKGGPAMKVFREGWGFLVGWGGQGARFPED
jgi:hypothetical protein